MGSVNILALFQNSVDTDFGHRRREHSELGGRSEGRAAFPSAESSGLRELRAARRPPSAWYCGMEGARSASATLFSQNASEPAVDTKR